MLDRFFSPSKFYSLRGNVLSVSRISCYGNETHLSECSMETGTSCAAGTNQVAGVICGGAADEPIARLLTAVKYPRSSEGFPFLRVQYGGPVGDWLFGGICDEVQKQTNLKPTQMH